MEVILLIQEDLHLKKLELHINSILKQDIYKNNCIECCPICKSSKYIKYGSYNKIQRYKCKECGKTFSNTTNALWSYSKKAPDKWIKFIELMIEKKSLRFCAEKLSINLITAFYWRHKVLYGLTLDEISNKLNGDIYIGKTIMKENFKGCKNITTHKRRNIWIVGAKDMKDSMLAKPICKDFWDLKSFKEKIYSKIQKESYIIPYGDRYISVVANEHNKKLSLKTRRLKEKDRIEEDKIRYFESNLNEWLSSFYGIATKYLERYLHFFILFNLDKIINYMDIMYYLSFGIRFIKIKEIRIMS